MKRMVRRFVVIVAVMSLLFTTVYASNSQKIEAMLNAINISVNDEKIAKSGDSYTLSNGTKVPYSINYAGTTYLPMRKVAELLNKDVEYISETKTANIVDKPGSELLPPMTVYTELSYDVNGTPLLEFVFYNLSGKDIKSFVLNTYCYDKDFIPVINKDDKGNSVSIFFEGSLGSLLKADESMEDYFLLDGFKGTELYDIVVEEVIFTDDSVWFNY